MSSILKALRKLEEEKAALGEGRVDLARDILKRSAPQRRAAAPLVLKVVFFSVLTLAVVAGLRMLLMTTEPTDTVAAVPSVPPRTPASAAASVTARQPTFVPAAGQAVASAGSEPQPSALETAPALPPAEPEVKIVAIDAAVVASAAAPVATIAKPAAAVGSQSQVEPVARVATPEPAVQPADRATAVSVAADFVPPVSAEIPDAAPPAAASLPDPTLPADLPQLLISAIAFRPVPGERLAVVNDLPVMEGTRIAGVEIVEILEQGVRFAWQGTEFVLPLAEPPPQN